MSHLPLQSTTQLSSFTHSLSAGAASPCSNNMDNAILSLNHSTELAGSDSFPIEDGTQVVVCLCMCYIIWRVSYRVVGALESLPPQNVTPYS